VSTLLSTLTWSGTFAPPADHYDYDWTITNANIAGKNERDGSAIVFAFGKYWEIGGWNSANPWPLGQGGSESTNEIWSSVDLVTWTMELAHVSNPPTSGAGARFKARHVFGCFTYTHGGTEYIYVLGGDEESAGHDDFSGAPSNGYQTDMWRSPDGTTWERVLESDSCPFAGRTQVVYGTSGTALWAFGGQNGLLNENPSTFHNGLWRSTDGGFTWTEVLADAAPSATRPAPRGSINRMPLWNGRMWLVSGGTYNTADVTDRNYYREVWSFDPSNPAIGFTQHAKPPWPGTMYNNVEVFNNRLWLLAGFSDPTDSGPVAEGKNTKTVWSTGDGERWDREETPPWARSHADATCVNGNTLAHVSGNGDVQETSLPHAAKLVCTAVATPVSLPAPIATWDIANVVLNGNNITQITDGTGNGHHLVPTSPGDAVYNASDPDFGGGPSAEGDSTNGGFLHTVDSVSQAGYTLFIVAKFGTQSGARYLNYSLLLSPLAYSYVDATKVSSHKYTLSTAHLRDGVATSGGLADPVVEMEDTRHIYRIHFDGTNEGTHVAIDNAIELPAATPLVGDAGLSAFSRPLYIGSDSSGTFCRAIKFVGGRLYPALTAAQYRQVERDLREAYPYSIPIPA
jgi:hypothetical protein